MKNFLKGKSIGFYIYLLTIILALVSFVYYISAANDTYGYDTIVIVLYVISIVVGCVFLALELYEVGPIVSGILYSAIFGMLIKGRLIYFVTQLMSISDQGVSSGVLLALLLLIVIVFLNMIGAFFSRERGLKNEAGI